MIRRLGLVAIALLVSCDGSSSKRAAAAPPTQGSSPKLAVAGEGSGDKPNSQIARDTSVLPVTTHSGGAVIGVGQPRMQLARDRPFRLALRAQRQLVVAEDAGSIALWNLATGELIRRIEPLPGPFPTAPTFAISLDAQWLAVGSHRKTRVYARPFDQVYFTPECSEARAFSHDSKLFACHNTLPEIWNVAEKKRVAQAPDSAVLLMPQAVQFSADDRSLYWATDHEIIRWNFSSGGALQQVHKSRDKLLNVVFSEGSDTAFISTRAPGSYKHTSALIDLASGTVSASDREFDAAISFSGKRIAYASGDQARVVDAASGKAIWSTRTAATVHRAAYANDADVIAYVEGKHVRVVDLATGPLRFGATSRFAGWIDEGVAAIERVEKLEQLRLADRTWSPADRATLVAKTSAPAWATWIATGGTVAAEASPRRTAQPDARRGTPCMPKLRTWSPKGGTKTLTMACGSVDSTDPGWDIGGESIVGVSSKSAIVYDAKTGRRTGVIHVERPRLDKPEFEWTFWDMALSQEANLLALISRGPKLPPEGTPDPREDALHVDDLRDKTRCETDLSGECRMEFALSLYTIGRTAERTWRVQLEPPHGDGRTAQPSAVAFDRAGKRILIGMADGEIHVMSTTSPEPRRIERFHHGPIVRLVVSPGGGWAFSEDAAGQQRLWPL